MGRFALISVGCHVMFVTAMTITWPAFNKDIELEDPLIIIDMVDIAEVTNVASASEGAPQDEVDQDKARPKPPPPPPPPPPPKPEAEVVEPSPEPKPTLQIDDSAAEILPDKKTAEVAKPVARPKPRPTPPKKKDPKPEPKPAAKPKPKPKPKPDLSKINELAQKSEAEKKRKDAANGVLQNLAEIQKTKEAEKKQAQKNKKEQAKENIATNLSNVVSKVQTKTDAKPSVTPIGVSELDRLKNHIGSYWNPPSAAAGADLLKVDIFVKLEPDGSVTEARIVENKRYNSDQTYRAAANAALRAVLDASPLPLPREKYELWREFIFGFDPRFISR